MEMSSPTPWSTAKFIKEIATYEDNLLQSVTTGKYLWNILYNVIFFILSIKNMFMLYESSWHRYWTFRNKFLIISI